MAKSKKNRSKEDKKVEVEVKTTTEVKTEVKEEKESNPLSEFVNDRVYGNHKVVLDDLETGELQESGVNKFNLSSTLSVDTFKKTLPDDLPYETVERSISAIGEYVESCQLAQLSKLLNVTKDHAKESENDFTISHEVTADLGDKIGKYTGFAGSQRKDGETTFMEDTLKASYLDITLKKNEEENVQEGIASYFNSLWSDDENKD